MRKTGLLVSVLLVISCLGLNSCKSGQRQAGKLRIGFSMDSLLIERWQRDRDQFVAHAKELGAEVLVQSADGNDSTQVRQCENLLTQGIDVLVIVPHNAEVMSSIVNSAAAPNRTFFLPKRSLVKAARLAPTTHPSSRLPAAISV